ncbi:MAG TPA: hypothetical protein VN726_00895 [Hanamia sp.]|nr:hypothetical protein [Hanamia sp.]
MRQLILAGIILLGFSCKKAKTGDKKEELITHCGIIRTTPILDSFVAPTYYITMMVSFPEGDAIVHYKGDVSGDHDGSWFLSKYNVDSTYCTEPVVK